MLYFNMIVSNNNLLNILTAKSNPLLKDMLKEADVKSLLNNLSNSKNKELDLSNIFKQLFTQVKDSTASNETVLNLLKSSNLTKDMGSFSKNLQTLLKNIEADPKMANLKSTLQNFMVNIEKATPNTIKEQISNSGIFLESKLLNILKSPNKSEALMLNDLKALLLKASEQLKDEAADSSTKLETSKQIDRLVNQIEYHQLYSLANSSNNIYIPFLWDLLEDGSIDTKKINDEKFYCKIDLTLQELGKVDVHLFMFDKKNIDITFFIEKNETKQTFRENASKLKQALHSAGVSIQTFEIYSQKEENPNSKELEAFKNSSFNFGLDIRV